MVQTSGIPFGVMIQPMACPTAYDYELETGGIPEIDFLEEGPFRCSRCHTYVNPNFMWNDAGKKAQCNMCLFENTVPSHYFCALNDYGKRLDTDKRPELTYGTYDIKAPAAFCTKKPQKPCFVVLLDISLHAYESGYMHQCLTSVKDTLESLPYPDDTSICVATFDSAIHFYLMPQDENAEPTVI